MTASSWAEWHTRCCITRPALWWSCPAVRPPRVPPQANGRDPAPTGPRPSSPRAVSTRPPSGSRPSPRTGLLDALVDGGEAARLDLPGKPRPDLFPEAARRLGAPAGRTAVVEDALAGVEAGLRGGFGLVVDVDRAAGTGTRDELPRHGADIVVGDPDDLLNQEAPP
ncbi:HAD family phosphatase [Streptomyces sp. D2-8]|nr:HAD family phosphatase [Streptomyces sp. D2-8]